MGAAGRRAAVVAAAERALCCCSGSPYRQSGGAAGQGRFERHLSERTAGRCRCQRLGKLYPDQSLYPVDSVPNVARRINNALLRADQVHHMGGKNGMYWLAPIVADAEAGYGGTL